MMENRLKNKVLGLLVADGVNATRLTTLTEELRGAGAHVTILTPGGGEVRSWTTDGWGDPVRTDEDLEHVQSDRFDGIIVAGGQIAADSLRQSHSAVGIVRRMIETGKPLAVFGHSVWLLVESELVTGMEVTGTPSIKTDLRASGAFWSDEPVVVDQGVVTIRSTDDFDEALPKILEEFAEGTHDRPGITDIVNEASEESFPASDPPAWQAGAPSRTDES